MSGGLRWPLQDRRPHPCAPLPAAQRTNRLTLITFSHPLCRGRSTVERATPPRSGKPFHHSLRHLSDVIPAITAPSTGVRWVLPYRCTVSHPPRRTRRSAAVQFILDAPSITSPLVSPRRPLHVSLIFFGFFPFDSLISFLCFSLSFSFPKILLPRVFYTFCSVSHVWLPPLSVKIIFQP